MASWCSSSTGRCDSCVCPNLAMTIWVSKVPEGRCLPSEFQIDRKSSCRIFAAPKDRFLWRSLDLDRESEKGPGLSSLEFYHVQQPLVNGRGSSLMYCKCTYPMFLIQTG